MAGYATSVPELLTISISSLSGLMGASIYNIISSNFINLVQYLSTIFLNKNQDKLRNKAILIDLILALFTILIPILMLCLNIKLNLVVVPVFILLYVIFKFFNSKAHKVYLQKQEQELLDEIKMEEEGQRGGKIAIIKCVALLIIAGVVLFFIGEKLSNILEELANVFKISEIAIGLLLGFSTSIPEFMTFFEAQKHHKNNENDMLGIVEASNNLVTSNLLNLFIIQSIGILLMIFK